MIISDPAYSIVEIWVNIFKTDKNIEKMQLVQLTELWGKVLSSKNDYKSVKTALLLFNVIDADHQKQLFFYKQRPLIGVLG